jgi:farnesyl diphosphate synthase
MGAICARADEAALDAIGQYGETIGLVFQLVDDLLDATAATETLGKTVGKDAATGKRTVVSELGIDAARRMTDELTARGVAVLEPLGNRGEKLRLLARALTERTH